MTPMTVLTRAHVASTRNHLTSQLGGVTQRNIAVTTGGLLLVGYNVFMYFGSSSLLGGVVEQPEVARIVLPVLPIVLSLPAFGIALVLTMLLPVESPLALQARLLGAGRWYCAASEFIPIAAAIAAASVVGLSGSFVFLATISDNPAATFIAMSLLGLAFGFLCLVIALGVERLLGLVRVPPRERRLWGVLAATITLSFLAVDLISWAATGGQRRGFSITSLLANLGATPLPQTWTTVIALAGICVLLLMLGIGFSFSDPAGGYLRAGNVAIPIPGLQTLGGQLIASELATWLRESASRVSFVAMLVIDTGLIFAARSNFLDPGVVLLLLVFISATGGELIIGRSRDINWTLRAIGLRDATVLSLRIGVVGIILTGFFTIAMVASGLIDNPPMRIVEAYSLFFAVFAIATLAGTLVPFDERAALSMFATSALSITLEIGMIVTVTTILQLNGIALVLADLLAVALCVILIATAFKRSRNAGA